MVHNSYKEANSTKTMPENNVSLIHGVVFSIVLGLKESCTEKIDTLAKKDTN